MRFNPAVPAFVTLATISIACADSPTDAPPEWPHRVEVAAAGQAGTSDAQLAELARYRLQGFAGTMIAEDRSHVVFITSNGDRAAARDYVTQLRARKDMPASEVRFVVVPYDFAQLYDWVEMLGAGGALTNAGAWWIDETTNSIVVVGDANVGKRVQMLATTLSIPALAFRLVEGDPLWVAENHRRLDLATDTTRAGYRIGTSRHPVAGACTMGPWGQLADHPATSVLITASHCTLTPFSTPDAGYVGQPGYDGTLTRVIGYEFSDTPFRSCSWIGWCRDSDAAYVIRNGTIPFAGGIANVIPATLYVNDTKSFLKILQMRASHLMEIGDSVYMTGSVNGRRGGTIVDTCVNTGPLNDVDEFGRVGRLRCLAAATYYSGNGDSGAPINNNATFLGIHYGQVQFVDGGPFFRAFSKIQEIVEELGAIDVCTGSPFPCPDWD